MRRQAGGMGQARQTLRQWIGQPPLVNPRSYAPTQENSTPDRAAIIAAHARMQPITAHPYLTRRGIPADLLDLPRFAGCVFQDERKNACFPHHDRNGVSGWEMKNQGFTGFSAKRHQGALVQPHQADRRPPCHRRAPRRFELCRPLSRRPRPLFFDRRKP